MIARHNCLLTLLLATSAMMPWPNCLIAQQPPEPTPQETTTTDTGQPTLPPELTQHLSQQLTPPPTAVQTDAARLTLRDRLLLVALAVGIMVIGGIICRLAAAAGGFGGSRDSILLLLGVFCGIAALCVACSVVATLRLHLAATICTILSGFCIGSFWLGQFAWAQQFLLPTRHKETQ